MIGLVLLPSRIGPDTSPIPGSLLAGGCSSWGGRHRADAEFDSTLAIRENAAASHQVAHQHQPVLRQIGSTVGDDLRHHATGSLLVELPKQLPAVPGMSVAKIDMGGVQSQSDEPELRI